MLGNNWNYQQDSARPYLHHLAQEWYSFPRSVASPPISLMYASWTIDYGTSWLNV